MIGSLLIVAAAVVLPSWVPSSSFALNCTGTQTVSTADSTSNPTIPWQDTYTIDLGQNTYCDAACTTPLAISAVTDTGLQLVNAVGQFDKSVIQYDVASSTLSSDVLVATTASDGIEVVNSGTCTMAALAPVQAPTPAPAPPADPSSPPAPQP